MGCQVGGEGKSVTWPKLDTQAAFSPSLWGLLEHLRVGGVALNLGQLPGRLVASTCWEGHGVYRGEHRFKAGPGSSWGFPSDLGGKEPTCNAGDPGLIPGLGRSPGEGNGNPFQYSCLENPMDRGAWRATVHGAAKS